jgi:uncharacterized membrane protein
MFTLSILIENVLFFRFYNKMTHVISVTILLVILIAIVVLQIVSLFGMIYLTRFSFNSKKLGNMRSVEMSDNEMTAAKISVVLFWFTFTLTILASILRYVNKD